MTVQIRYSVPALFLGEARRQRLILHSSQEGDKEREREGETTRE